MYKIIEGLCNNFAWDIELLMIDVEKVTQSQKFLQLSWSTAFNENQMQPTFFQIEEE